MNLIFLLLLSAVDVRPEVMVVAPDGGVGTAVHIGKNRVGEDLLLTAAHVVGEAGVVKIEYADGQYIDGVVLGRRMDDTADIAMVAVDNASENVPHWHVVDRDYAGSVYVRAIPYGDKTRKQTRSGVIRTAHYVDGTTVVEGESGGAVVTPDGRLVGVIKGYLRLNGVTVITTGYEIGAFIGQCGPRGCPVYWAPPPPTVYEYAKPTPRPVAPTPTIVVGPQGPPGPKGDRGESGVPGLPGVEPSELGRLRQRLDSLESRVKAIENASVHVKVKGDGGDAYNRYRLFEDVIVLDLRTQEESLTAP